LPEKRGGGAATVASAVPLAHEAHAQQTGVAANAPAVHPGDAYLNLEEQAFIEAVVNHKVPADEPTPAGTDVGLNIQGVLRPDG
jgi:gluconate 2-dehydrogenase gamma chain